MNNEMILWLVCGGGASLLLLAMMRRRQAALDGLLHAYIQRQTQGLARGRRRAQPAASGTANKAAKPAEDAAATAE